LDSPQAWIQHKPRSARTCIRSAEAVILHATRGNDGVSLQRRACLRRDRCSFVLAETAVIAKYNEVPYHAEFFCSDIKIPEKTVGKHSLSLSKILSTFAVRIFRHLLPVLSLSDAMILLRPTNTFQLFPFGLRPLSGKEVPPIRPAATLSCTGPGNERRR